MHLYKTPFEPLSKASLLHLSMKTAFLITMATARCVSEVHAFSIDKDHLRFSKLDGSLTLRNKIGFSAKNQLCIYIRHHLNHYLKPPLLNVLNYYIWTSRVRLRFLKNIHFSLYSLSVFRDLYL